MGKNVVVIFVHRNLRLEVHPLQPGLGLGLGLGSSLSSGLGLGLGLASRSAFLTAWFSVRFSSRGCTSNRSRR